MAAHHVGESSSFSERSRKVGCAESTWGGCLLTDPKRCGVHSNRLGLGVSPGYPTIWRFREALVAAGVIDGLFARFEAELKDRG